eukprot:COSAG01_NODE_16955_length_1190_cov_17.888285_1_plen_396_part_11
MVACLTEKFWHESIRALINRRSERDSTLSDAAMRTYTLVAELESGDAAAFVTIMNDRLDQIRRDPRFKDADLTGAFPNAELTRTVTPRTVELPSPCPLQQPKNTRRYFLVRTYASDRKLSLWDHLDFQGKLESEICRARFVIRSIVRTSSLGAPDFPYEERFTCVEKEPGQDGSAQAWETVRRWLATHLTETDANVLKHSFCDSQNYCDCHNCQSACNKFPRNSLYDAAVAHRDSPGARAQTEDGADRQPQQQQIQMMHEEGTESTSSIKMIRFRFPDDDDGTTVADLTAEIASALWMYKRKFARDGVTRLVERRTVPDTVSGHNLWTTPLRGGMRTYTFAAEMEEDFVTFLQERLLGNSAFREGEITLDWMIISPETLQRSMTQAKQYRLFRRLT